MAFMCGRDVGVAGNYGVAISPGQINQGDAFTMTVTAYLTVAICQVVSSTGTSVTLANATGFPTSGSGTLFTGTTATKFSWTGLSGNTLTGASGHGSPAAGTRCEAEPGIDTTYAGTAEIIGRRSNGSVVNLGVRSIAPGDWTSGVATITESVLYFGSSNDNVTFEVRELAGIGRMGHASISIQVPVDTWIGVPNNGGSYRFGSQATLISGHSSGVVGAVLGTAVIVVSSGALGSPISINRTSATGVDLIIRDPAGTVTRLAFNPSPFTPSVAGEHWLYASVNLDYGSGSVTSTLQLKDRTGAINVTISADMACATSITGTIGTDTIHTSYGTPTDELLIAAVLSANSGIVVSGCADGSSTGDNANQHMNSRTPSKYSDTEVQDLVNFTITAGAPGGFAVYVLPELTVADGSGAPSIEGALGGSVRNVWPNTNRYSSAPFGPNTYFGTTILVP